MSAKAMYVIRTLSPLAAMLLLAIVIFTNLQQQTTLRKQILTESLQLTQNERLQNLRFLSAGLENKWTAYNACMQKLDALRPIKDTEKGGTQFGETYFNCAEKAVTIKTELYKFISYLPSNSPLSQRITSIFKYDQTDLINTKTKTLINELLHQAPPRQ